MQLVTSRGIFPVIAVAVGFAQVGPQLQLSKIASNSLSIEQVLWKSQPTQAAAEMRAHQVP